MCVQVSGTGNAILLFKLSSNLHLAAVAANAVSHFSAPVVSQPGGKRALAISEKLKSSRLLFFRPRVPMPLLGETVQKSCSRKLVVA
jgi:hypothetical protein